MKTAVLNLPLWYLCNFATKYKGVEKIMQIETIRVPKCTARQAKEFDVAGGDIPVFTAGSAVYHTTREVAGEYVCDLPKVIAIGNALGNDTVKMLKGPFVCANCHIAVVRDEGIVLTEYLYNVLKYAVGIERHFHGVTLQTARMDEILRLDIPVPEMWYQKQVVDWLEKVHIETDIISHQIDELDNYMQFLRKKTVSTLDRNRK